MDAEESEELEVEDPELEVDELSELLTELSSELEDATLWSSVTARFGSSSTCFVPSDSDVGTMIVLGRTAAT